MVSKKKKREAAEIAKRARINRMIDSCSRSDKQWHEYTDAEQFRLIARIADWKPYQQRERSKRKSNPIICRCRECGDAVSMIWMIVGGQTYCYECYYTIFSWKDGSIPTDPEYKRRLF